MNKFFKTLGIVAVGLFLVACGNAESAETEDKTLTIGVNTELDADIWRDVAERLLEEDGITLNVEIFSDGIQPNEAVENKDIEMNGFQHQIYLAEYVNSTGSEIIPAAYTLISPMSAFSREINDLSELEEGDEVVITNDPTNTSRALRLLESAGVLTLSDDAGLLPTTDDIVENPKNIVITEVAAAQVPRSVEDAAAIVSSLSFAIDYGLEPEEAIYTDSDDLSNEDIAQYKNIVVIHPDNQDDPLIQRAIEEYQSEETVEVIKEVTQQTNEAAWTDEDDPVADFETILEQAQAE